MFRCVVDIVAVVETVIVVFAVDVVNVVVVVFVTNIVGREKRIDGFKKNELLAVPLIFPISRTDA